MRLSGLLGAVVCCLLLSTCGTGRAIIDDYADDYVIRNVRPLSTVSGEETIFEADLCFNSGARVSFSDKYPMPKFTWDFGGGAEPNVSFDTMPEVTIRDGIRAPYECSVEARGGCLGEETVTATFTLDVEPLSVLVVTPTTGIAGGAGTFTAVIGSGNATSWAWDFGGASTPAGANVENPAVIFTTQPGVYNARVIVSNQFEATEYAFTINVLENPSLVTTEE